MCIRDSHRTGLKQLLVVSEGGIQQKVRETYLNQRSELFIDTYADYTVTLVTTNNYNWSNFYKNNITAGTGAYLQAHYTSHL